MSWTLLGLATLGVTVALLFTTLRRLELARMARSAGERHEARERGSHAARLQYPQVDLARCLGCGTCVRACPEEGVLDLLHGQAIVVHGARCVGHGMCARECPTGAIRVALGDLEERRDIPVLSETLESPHVPGLFLAGEVTGYALIRTAITHGVAIAGEVARRRQDAPRADGVHDLCIVGAGPAGLACSLEAKARGLDSITLEQERLGGTVASYPRRKLVLTQPVELPLGIRLDMASYEKEDLMRMWEDAARRHELPVYTGQVYQGLERGDDGVLVVRTQAGEVRAHNVCLALGRRGSPRKLGVPGEDLPKVAYSLIDAQSYQGRRILVVGGGDSAIEAAIGLAQQPGNEVVLSYRKHAFFRIKARNEKRLADAVELGALEVLFSSNVTRIAGEHVDLEVAAGGADAADADRVARRIPNDDVFVFAGGTPPFQLLEASGVSFDPAEREPDTVASPGRGLLPALAVATALALASLAWALAFRDYYGLAPADRPEAARHAILRPSGPTGLALGTSSVLLILANLAYLLRRSARVRLAWGSLQAWMTSHLVTGVAALVLAILHSAMAPRDTVGGHALLALGALVLTGAVGRYFYSLVPHAANGRELELEEVESQLAALAASWDRGQRELGERVRADILRLVGEERWRGSLVGRIASLVRSQARARSALAGWLDEARERELSEEQIAELASLARRAHRAALVAAHFEDLRALLASWRYFHRWVALLMVLLVAAHVATALRYGGLLDR